MKQTLSETILDVLSNKISEEMGLFFPPSKWKELERAFHAASKELGFESITDCAKWFISEVPSKEVIEIISSYLTINETYFYRDRQYFEFLHHKIMPEIIKRRNQNSKYLRIWSAGCSTGEEPYSIAITLYRMKDMLKDWNISILATDINLKSLKKAESGIYSEWSFRNVPRWFKESYFQCTSKGLYKLIPEIKSMVDFKYFNIAKDTFPSLLNGTNAMDIIFCRNVLMYFKPQIAGRVVEQFYSSLRDGGWIFVSPCETHQVLFSKFDINSEHNMIVYKKINTQMNWDFSSESFPIEFQNDDKTPPKQLIETNTEFVKPINETRVCIPDDIKEHIVDNNLTVQLSREYANEGKLVEALNLSEQAITNDKLNPALHYLQAVILQEQERIDESISALKKVLYLDPNFIVAHFTIGNLLLSIGNTKEAKRHFNNALLILEESKQSDIIPESDGMVAGRFIEIIRSTLEFHKEVE